MSAAVIPLRAARGAPRPVPTAPGSGISPAQAASLDAVLLGLRDRQAALLAVIEGLGAGGSARHGVVGPLATELEAISRRALAQVDLLICRAERLARGAA